MKDTLSIGDNSDKQYDINISDISIKTGISSNLLNEIIRIISKYKNVEKAVIFGSRARGNFKKISDIDICIFGDDMTHKEMNLMEFEIKEIDTPLDFDVINFKSISKDELKKNILNDGVEIYVRKKDV